MYINLVKLQSLFSDKKTVVHISKNHVCLSGYQHLSLAPKKKSLHMVYLADDVEQLLSYIDDGSISSILITDDLVYSAKLLEDNLSDTNNYLIIEHTTLQEVALRLQPFFDTKCGCGLMADSLISFLFHDSSLQDLVEYASAHILCNPILVFDASFNLLASYIDFPDLPTDDHIRTIVANQGFAEEDFSLPYHALIHKRLMHTEEPIVAYNNTYQINQMVCAITTKRNIGHIVMNASCHPFDESDLELFYLLKKVIHERLQKSEFIRNNKGYNSEYYLRDLLEQKTAIPHKYNHKLDPFTHEMSGNFQCLVIDGSRSGNMLNLQHVRNLFDNRLSNTKSVIFGENQLIIVFSLGKRTELSQNDYEKVELICEAQQLYAGISNPFSDILELHAYYQQALRAIELGSLHKDAPHLYRYDSYYMQHMMGLFTQRESAKTFSHPAMLRLLTYDAEHHTVLAPTLAEWLRCERNASIAADQLQIHRNTLTNRLRKVDQMVDLDYEDAALRQYLLLSYDLSCL